MAWIESHQTLARHPKAKRLARLLGAALPTVIGHLHYLWWWTLDFASDGDISKYEDVEIAEVALWEGDAAFFISALTTSGFVDEHDGTRVLHDWDDYAGKLIERRRRNAEQMRAARQKERLTTDKPRVKHVSTRVKLPYPTVPNPTVPDLEITKVISIQKNKREPTANDQFLEAFCDSIGTRPGTKSEWAKWGNGVKEIRGAEPVVTLEEIPDIVHIYRKRCPTLPCNPAAIAAHLSDYRDMATFGGPAPIGTTVPEHDGIGEPAWKAFLRLNPVRLPPSAPTELNGRSSEPV